MSSDADSAGVYFLSREAFEARGKAAVSAVAERSEHGPANSKQLNDCDECGSDYYVGSSEMASLCPECAHRLYECPACRHVFRNGRCELCHWDGSVSPNLANRRSPTED